MSLVLNASGDRATGDVVSPDRSNRLNRSRPGRVVIEAGIVGAQRRCCPLTPTRSPTRSLRSEGCANGADSWGEGVTAPRRSLQFADDSCSQIVVGLISSQSLTRRRRNQKQHGFPARGHAITGREPMLRRCSQAAEKSSKKTLRKCAETIYRVSMPGWHVPEFAKGVVCLPRPSQTQGRATRKAVRKNCTLPKRSIPGWVALGTQ